MFEKWYNLPSSLQYVSMINTDIRRNSDLKRYISIVYYNSRKDYFTICREYYQTFVRGIYITPEENLIPHEYQLSIS